MLLVQKCYHVSAQCVITHKYENYLPIADLNLMELYLKYSLSFKEEK